MNNECILILCRTESPKVKSFKEKLSQIGNTVVIQGMPNSNYYFPHLKKIDSKLVPGSNHFPVLDFALKNSYDYYWLFEDDVTFSGDWKDFFSLYENADHDFITSGIMHSRPDWFWYKIGSQFSPTWKSLNPCYRISRKAVDILMEHYEKGIWGHHEKTMISILKPLCKVADLNDFGKRIYSNFTFRYSPPFMKLDKPDKLYHPYKYFNGK